MVLKRRPTLYTYRDLIPDVRTYQYAVLGTRATNVSLPALMWALCDRYLVVSSSSDFICERKKWFRSDRVVSSDAYPPDMRGKSALRGATNTAILSTHVPLPRRHTTTLLAMNRGPQRSS